MKTYIIGDIHGAHKALLQCLERVSFDYQEDRLICLGDVCDGWSHTKECIDELLKVKNLIYVLGNHDEWALDWMKYGYTPSIWVNQGGYATINSYGNLNDVPKSHIEFLEKAFTYYAENEILFVHGGIDPQTEAKNQPECILLWDRTLIRNARIKHFIKPNYQYVKKYKEVFIGHTTTLCYDTTEPIHVCNVWDLDTGAGWSGKLTIMNLNTRQYWQSDFVKEIYPNEKGRG